jgi:Fe-S-cluster containining protein
VILVFDPQERAAELLADPETGPNNLRNAEWMRDHWSVVDTYEDDEGDLVRRVRCDAYDPVNRLCGAHEQRPPVCSDFPWYGRDPNGEASRDIAAALPPQCSFNADVAGRRMLPVVEVR